MRYRRFYSRAITENRWDIFKPKYYVTGLTFVKGGPIARSKSLKIHFMISFDRVGRDKSVGTGLTVKLGLVWQTEALECPKNSFTEIAI